MKTSLNLTQRSLIGLAIAIVFILLVLPLLLIISQAFSQGFMSFWHAIIDSDMQHAIKLTLLVAAISVPINLIFGVFLAWF